MRLERAVRRASRTSSCVCADTPMSDEYDKDDEQVS